MQEAVAKESLSSETVCLLNFEIGDSPIVAAARSAREAGVREVVVNPAPARRLPDPLVALAPLLTPNAGEAVALLGGDTPIEDPQRAATRLSAVTGSPVVVTLGAKGALLAAGQDQRRYKAPEVRATDATGAGDAFNGALAAALAQGFELPEAVARGVAAATRSVQSQGARGGLPTRGEIDQLMDGSARPLPL